METNENKQKIQTDRQPSLREQANARMREASLRKSSSERGRQSVNDEYTPKRNTVSPERKAASDRQISPERKAASEKRSVAERPAAERKTASERRTVSERPSAERKTVSEKPASEKRIVSERPAAERRTASERPAAEKKAVTQKASSERVSKEPQRSPKRERPAAKDAVNTERSISKREHSSQKKKFPIFWVAFILYVIILLILSGVFLIYTDKCLARYENSQSEKYMAEYINTFKEKVQTNGFSESDFSFGDLDLTFADTSSIVGDYLDSLKTVSEFSFEKDPSSYLTEAPLYNILGDGEPVARVSLKSIDQTKIFAILTIMEWDVDSVSPICSVEVSEFTFSIPEGFTPVISGKTVDASYQTGERTAIPEFVNVSEYVPMPDYIEYKVPNVLADAEISVLDLDGNPVEFTRNGNIISSKYTTGKGVLTDERKDESLRMVQTYDDIMTDDLGGGDHGFSKVATFLIKDSYYYNYVKQWTTGVDITFTSAHRFDDPKYTDVVVDDYVEYSDNCYSVHISFVKHMVLTRNGEKRTNTSDQTIFFVNYDDTDDGIDNPHWCIVDMIATLNN